MNSTIKTTASATGQSVTWLVILNWLLAGHPMPMPADVAGAIVAGVALLSHAAGCVVLRVIEKFFPAAQPVVEAVQDAAAQGGAA